MKQVTFSAGQQKAYDQVIEFILHPSKKVFVLEGYSGTGKSTLVERVIDMLPKLIKTEALISANPMSAWPLQLTATTNKAAEALRQITGADVVTIHKFLNLRVSKNYKTQETMLVRRNDVPNIVNTIIVIDEASFIDRILIRKIFEHTSNCKILFIGDPAQIVDFRAKDAPVFNSGFETAKLTEVVRQAEGNPIIELSTEFRKTVTSGKFFNFKPDGVHIKHLKGDEFEAAVLAEFTRKDWKNNDSKVLAWTNQTVIDYNHAIRERIQGEPRLQVDDYAICNKHVSHKKFTFKTDQLVQITAISPAIEMDLPGYHVELDKLTYFFMPESRDEMKAKLKWARAKDFLSMVRTIEDTWIDLRAAYACTINKSQGSTYDRVFIDLDDVSQCNLGNTIARMMYVAVSRARHEVILTGDFV